MQKEGTCVLLCIATITAPTARPCCFAKATKFPLPKAQDSQEYVHQRQRTTENSSQKSSMPPIARPW